jgi:hypothetical protein
MNPVQYAEEIAERAREQMRALDRVVDGAVVARRATEAALRLLGSAGGSPAAEVEAVRLGLEAAGLLDTEEWSRCKCSVTADE